MSLTHVDLEIANVATPDRTVRMSLLVDSGATYSVVPTPVLVDLGIEPITSQVFTLANGQKISRRKGGAVYRYGERVGVADVIFGEEGDANLLGAFSLEALGLGLDPLRRTLIELPMLLTFLNP
jgi:predicted aspartyl protease